MREGARKNETTHGVEDYGPVCRRGHAKLHRPIHIEIPISLHYEYSIYAKGVSVVKVCKGETHTAGFVHLKLQLDMTFTLVSFACSVPIAFLELPTDRAFDRPCSRMVGDDLEVRRSGGTHRVPT